MFPPGSRWASALPTRPRARWPGRRCSIPRFCSIRCAA
jgi:hypothetical protein